MTGEARVRRMRNDDISRVMEIAAGLQETPRWTEAAYAAVLAPGPVRRVALVVQGLGGVDGFVIASVIGPQAELESIGVAAEHQRCGLGSRLMEALGAELLGAGAEEVFLEVRASNRAALDLYGRAGFTEMSRRPRYYADPVEDAVLMRLAVRQSHG